MIFIQTEQIFACDFLLSVFSIFVNNLQLIKIIMSFTDDECLIQIRGGFTKCKPD